MIIVRSSDKPFEYTVKGTLRRQACLRIYETEIEAVYAAVENSSQTELTPPSEWNAQTTLEFVNTVVEKVMKRKLGTEDDIFQNGCDRYLHLHDCIVKCKLMGLPVQSSSYLDPEHGSICFAALDEAGVARPP